MSSRSRTELVGDLLQRLGERLLLVEQRRNPDGSARLLVVLDADSETLAHETKRAAANGAHAAEFLDLREWRTMWRLASTGLLQFTHEAQELYRSRALPAETSAAETHVRRGADAIADADRALRMAMTLTEGGFPEEAPALLSRSLRAMASALMAARGEAARAPGAASADIHHLVECGALPAEARALLDATRAVSIAASADEVAPLLSATTRILTAIGRNEPSLSARHAASS